VFNNVAIREVRIAILLLPPKKHYLTERNKDQKEVRMQGSKLYVGNLSFSVTKEQLEELFSNYGEVRQVNIIEGRGFGFVEMSNPSEAEKAKEALNGSDFKGRNLKVDQARPPRNRQRRDYRRY
jgi:RNA recognition motif-containing protein